MFSGTHAGQPTPPSHCMETPACAPATDATKYVQALQLSADSGCQASCFAWLLGQQFFQGLLRVLLVCKLKCSLHAAGIGTTAQNWLCSSWSELCSCQRPCSTIQMSSKGAQPSLHCWSERERGSETGPCLGCKAFDEDAAGAIAGLLCANGSAVRWLDFHNAPIQLHAIHAFHCCLHVRPAAPHAEGCQCVTGAGWSTDSLQAVCLAVAGQGGTMLCPACPEASEMVRSWRFLNASPVHALGVDLHMQMGGPHPAALLTLWRSIEWAVSQLPDSIEINPPTLAEVWSSK